MAQFYYVAHIKHCASETEWAKNLIHSRHFGIESIGVTSNGDMTDIPCGRDTSRTLVLLFLARGPIVFHLSFTSC